MNLGVWPVKIKLSLPRRTLKQIWAWELFVAALLLVVFLVLDFWFFTVFTVGDIAATDIPLDHKTASFAETKLKEAVKQLEDRENFLNNPVFPAF